MTLNEIAYSLIGLIRGDLKDNDYLDIRLIYYFIHTQRANWLNKELSKPYPNIQSFEQDLGAVEVESIDSNVYNTISAGINILRTKVEIPKPLFKKGLALITRVGSLDITHPSFDYMSYHKAIFFGNGKFNSNQIAAFYDRNRIILKSKSNPFIGGIKYINIRGIFENPASLKGFTDIEGNLCYSPDTNYPISPELIDYLHGDIMQYKLQALLDTPTDKLNDADTTLQSNSTGTK